MNIFIFEINPFIALFQHLKRKKFTRVFDEDYRMILPYAIVHWLARIDLKDIKDESSSYLVRCIKEFIGKVDDKISNEEPWKFWATFGAYFHAFRINSLLVIGWKTAKIQELFSGALINCSFNEELVLKPTSVVYCSENSAALSSS